MLNTETSQSLTVEFHCHTIYSKDSLTTPEQLVATCQRKGIQRVIITDHNSIRGAQLAQKIDPQRVIVGEEIMTQDGELLAAYVMEEIPAGLTAKETIANLRQQGAFISVAHPFDELRGGHWKLPALERILPDVDAIEVFNARCMNPVYNQRALAYAAQKNLAGTVGSDAHTPYELGRCTLLMPSFVDAASLKAALMQSQMQVKLSSLLVHFSSRYAVLYKKTARLLGLRLPTSE